MGKLTNLFGKLLRLLILICFVEAIFFAKRLTQLCVKSDKQTIQSMCLLCDANQFKTVAYTCTGQYMVPANTSSEQAFCLISTCLRQVPGQYATPIGKRKRQVLPEPNFLETFSTTIVDGDEELSMAS